VAGITLCAAAAEVTQHTAASTMAVPR